MTDSELWPWGMSFPSLLPAQPRGQVLAMKKTRAGSGGGGGEGRGSYTTVFVLSPVLLFWGVREQQQQRGEAR